MGADLFSCSVWSALAGLLKNAARAGSVQKLSQTVLFLQHLERFCSTFYFVSRLFFAALCDASAATSEAPAAGLKKRSKCCNGWVWPARCSTCSAFPAFLGKCCRCGHGLAGVGHPLQHFRLLQRFCSTFGFCAASAAVGWLGYSTHCSTCSVVARLKQHFRICAASVARGWFGPGHTLQHLQCLEMWLWVGCARPALAALAALLQHFGKIQKRMVDEKLKTFRNGEN